MLNLPYWIQETLISLPAFLAVYVLMGIPFAYGILSRKDWRHRSLILMTGFAVGSGLLTVVMLLLGSWERPYLTRSNVLIALAILWLIGSLWWFIKHRQTATTPLNPDSIPTFFYGVVVLIGLAVVLRWIVIAYWPFTAYDALWVYGYEGRLYALKGFIPNGIGYYPQFLPLQYTYGQLLFGDINDSAARAVLPLLHIGAILAVYNLGARLFNRRVGIFAAAIWTFYPAVGEWSRMGDLEIPLTFLVTASAVFFFRAWFESESRYHHAVIAGILYGFALWTKPTAGAFALGIMFINVLALWHNRSNLNTYRPRFFASAIMALAAAPIGGAWYIRNLLLGHDAVDFPPEYWHTLAERGGGQLLWPLAILTLFLVFVFRTQPFKPNRALNWTGYTLILFGVIPSAIARFIPTISNDAILWFYPSLDGLPRLGLFEWGLIVIGLLLIGKSFYDVRAHIPSHPNITRTLWIIASAFPYFVVYFWNYSYHYRLAFAIVPLLIIPIAVLIDAWLTHSQSNTSQVKLKGWQWAIMLLLMIPGFIIPLRDRNLGWDYLWNANLPDDTAKQNSGNEALMWMVDGFQIYESENGEPPRVMAPGIQRLPFFFPLADITIDETPTQLSELEGYTYFVDSHPDGTGMYLSVSILDNQVLSALGRNDIMRRAWWKDDGIFRYEIYELNLGQRFEPYTPIAAVEDEVIFGGFARFVGHELGTDVFEIGQLRTLKLFWEVLASTDHDYMTYIHLRRPDGTIEMAWDGPVGLTEDGRYYTTRVWEVGERIMDERRFRYTNENTPAGDGYEIVIGLYDLTSGERVTVTQNGEVIGDGYRLDENITIIPPQEEN